MVDIYNKDGEKVGKVDLPEQFLEYYRPDIIKRAVLAVMSRLRQAYGADPNAGLRSSAKYIGNRHKFNTQANRGMHRTQRIRRGSGHMTWRARIVPGVVKGRKAHPPVSWKNFVQEINHKERKKAIRSAISATSNKEFVLMSGSKVENVKSFPLVIDNSFDSLNKTKEVVKALEVLGLKEELERVKVRKIRAGKGKMRNRKYKKKVGPLIVYNDEMNLSRIASNIPGVDVVNVRELNAKVLSPGMNGVRMTIWTKSALEEMSKNRLFM